MDEVTAREAIAVYPTTEELHRERLAGGASNVGVVRVQDGGDFGDRVNLSNLFDRSLVYPDPATNHRAREDVVWNSTYRQPFNQTQLPLTPSNLTILSNSGVMKYLCISMALPVNTNADVTLPRGWGIYLIDHVDFIVSGTTIQMFSQQIAQWYFHQMDSQSQLDAVFELAGAARSGAWADGVPTSLVLLPVPWSIPGGWCIDTSLLQANNISVQVYLKSITSVAGGAQAPLLTNAIKYGNFFARTGQFVSPSRDSILGELAAFTNVDGDQLVQSNIFQQMMYFPTLSLACTAGVDQTINLTGFDLSRRLKGLVLSFIQTSQVSPTGGLPVNPAAYETVNRIQLFFLGRQLFNTFATEEVLLESLMYGIRPQYLSAQTWNASATNPFQSTNVAAKIYRLMFTLADNDSDIEIGIPGVQSLQLLFQTAATANYDVYVSYLYNRNLSFTGTGVEIS